MKSAISERLTDLIGAAEQLREMIDHERPDRPLHGLLLARCAVDADHAASQLARHVELLVQSVRSGNQPPTRGGDQ
jgi:hypothetical protein